MRVVVPIMSEERSVDWLNDVLKYKARFIKCLPQRHSHKNTDDPSAARSQDRWITSKTLDHWAKQDP